MSHHSEASRSRSLTPSHAAKAAAGAALVLFACAACSARQDDAVSPAEAASAADEAGYLAAPGLIAAERVADGVNLSGSAPPGAQVRLASPDGTLLTAQADPQGRWALVAPAASRPAMFAFSAVAGERTLRGEGAVLIAPAPGPAALLLRAGFGAQSLGQGSAQPVILAVDYDASGGAAVAGLARPGAAVGLSLDGARAGFGQTDAAGRFAVTAANRTLAPGVRNVEVETPEGRAQVSIEASAPASLDGAAYRAERVRGAWRIDWAPPGGGVQTSVIFDQAERAP